MSRDVIFDENIFPFSNVPKSEQQQATETHQDISIPSQPNSHHPASAHHHIPSEIIQPSPHRPNNSAAQHPGSPTPTSPSTVGGPTPTPVESLQINNNTDDGLRSSASPSTKRTNDAETFTAADRRVTHSMHGIRKPKQRHDGTFAWIVTQPDEKKNRISIPNQKVSKLP